jgi:hypothetical protein
VRKMAEKAVHWGGTRTVIAGVGSSTPSRTQVGTGRLV